MTMNEMIHKFFEYNDMEVVIVLGIFVLGCVIGGIYCVLGWKGEESEKDKR